MITSFLNFELWDPVDCADWLGNLFVAAANAGYTVVKSAFPIHWVLRPI